jgi:hypothetical protein
MVVQQDELLNLADIRRITGEQGSGKTNTAVSFVVDDCYSKLDKIINLQTGEYYKARPLNEKEIEFIENRGIVYDNLKHIKVFNQDGATSKIITKPKGWVIDSPVKVFCNFRLYGIRYRYVDDTTIIENVNSDTLTNGWLILDESVLTEKRDTMTAVGKIVAWFGAQTRRRHLHMIIIAQDETMLQSRFNLFSTTTIDCSFDEDTKMIDLVVKSKLPNMSSTSFYGPKYWKFYKHDEIVKVPQHRVDKIMHDINNIKR